MPALGHTSRGTPTPRLNIFQCNFVFGLVRLLCRHDNVVVVVVVGFFLPLFKIVVFHYLEHNAEILAHANGWLSVCFYG